ncbi:ABC transporter permease [Reyranella sp. CPCC 100927]|uniref:ABC transporter permease n=1 Tax=Reyranella sp. CPCC 100927 TaxID=2599616 RepID=UPI0011B45333|nr:ABC transporter permease [Reyranella sp. CPCC 100927]TWS99835.1 ABC transporter permease [Reyranella sp. CPCC 100927]
MRLAKTAQERLLTILTPVAVLALWQILSQLGVISARYVPSPAQIFQTGWQLILTGELLIDVAASLYRLAIGFALGAIPGILIGMVMGLNRFVRAMLDPLIAAIYPVPKIALLPLLMLFFGIGDGSKIAVVAVAVFFLVAINTTVGVMGIDRVYLDVARNFATPWPKLFRRVILPGALPTIFAGLRISLGVAFIVLVSAEFVASRAGIGFLIWTSWQTLVIDNMFVGIIAITVLGLLASFVLKELERHLIPWRSDDR